MLGSACTFYHMGLSKKGVSVLSPHYPRKIKGSFLREHKESHPPKKYERIPNKGLCLEFPMMRCWLIHLAKERCKIPRKFYYAAVKNSFSPRISPIWAAPVESRLFPDLPIVDNSF